VAPIAPNRHCLNNWIELHKIELLAIDLEKIPPKPVFFATAGQLEAAASVREEYLQAHTCNNTQLLSQTGCPVHLPSKFEL